MQANLRNELARERTEDLLREARRATRGHRPHATPRRPEPRVGTPRWS